jgi:hypothetical protein
MKVMQAGKVKASSYRFSLLLATRVVPLVGDWQRNKIVEDDTQSFPDEAREITIKK